MKLRPPVSPPKTQAEWDRWTRSLDIRMGDGAKVEDAINSKAPKDAQFLVGSGSALLSAERLVTDTATISWDFGTLGQAKASLAYVQTAAEQSAGITPTVPAYEPGDARRYGVVGNGVANDRAALSAAVNSGHKVIRVPAGTYLLGTDTVITVPGGVTVEGEGPETIFRKTSGAADFFTTTGSNVTFRNFRMEGPNNTGCDGITTSGGEDILIENIEGYQLSTTVTIGLSTATDRATVRNIFSEENTQQGVLFNKATRAKFWGLRAKNVGTSNLHHGVYVGGVTDLEGTNVDSEGCSGAGINIFSQSGFAAKNITIRGIHCRGCGTAASSVRGGVVVARDSTSSLHGVTLSDLQLYDNDDFDLYVENVDELIVVNPYADGNSRAVANGLYFGATTSGITCNYKVIGGQTKAHTSNVRIPASAGCTINLSLIGLKISDASGVSDIGLFASGSGTVNLTIDSTCEFVNNTTNITNTASAGAMRVAGPSGVTASVADGGTITHGHVKTPTSVRAVGSVAGEMVSVTAIGATTFTVAIKKHDGTAGTSQSIYWQVDG